MSNLTGLVRPVKVLSPLVRLKAQGPSADPVLPTHKAKQDGSTGVEIKEGMIRVYAKNNVLGLQAEHWGDVPIGKRGLQECIRRGFVLVEGPDGEPAPLRLAPRSCAGCGGTGQH